MSDVVPPPPPSSPIWTPKAHVTEKDPKHQHDDTKKKKKPEQEEVEDEVVLSSEATDSEAQATQSSDSGQNSKPPSPLDHNIDIEV